ncbi:hypothetical protein [Hyalangium versicolor]|uniref:hypothetical protein n=1 Tax=Hyalangium versicolor TaxID=2861190 RepID=UPI001CCC6BB8|nr:hypothetical protein [Hyalangium versicolor]
MNSMKLLFLSAVITSAGACGGSIDDASLDESAAAPAGQLQSPLGEMGCTTVAANAIIDEPLDPGSFSETYSATSLTNSYGSGSCPSQFVVEVRQTRDRNLTPIAGWAASELMPGSEVTCGYARLEVGVYGQYLLSKWEKTGTARYVGKWGPLFDGGPSFCTFQPDPQYPNTIPYQLSPYYVRLRVAVRGTRSSFSTFVKVQGGVMSLQ